MKMADEQQPAASSLSGMERAAILLMSLGEQEASEVLRHVGAREVQRIGTTMAALPSVTRDQALEVLDNFVTTVEEKTSLGIGSDDYVRTVLKQALGDNASSMIDRILLGRKSKGLEAMKWMDPRSVAEMVRQEHPQIIAIVLAYLESDQAAEVLSQLPEQVRADVIMRVATIDGIPPAAFEELDSVMEKQFQGTENVKSSSVGGIRAAAEMLNLVEGATEEQIMSRISEHDDMLSEKIRDEMFVFDNIADLDDRSIQTLLRDVESKSLTKAVKGADQSVKEKIMRNMSRRASEMLEEDIEAMGPVRLSDVEAAQKEILGVVRSLSDEGQIEFGGKGEEYV